MFDLLMLALISLVKGDTRTAVSAAEDLYAWAIERSEPWYDAWLCGEHHRWMHGDGIPGWWSWVRFRMGAWRMSHEVAIISRLFTHANRRDLLARGLDPDRYCI